MPRVSVVRVSAEQVVFASHTGVEWATRDLADSCGDGVPEVGQVGDIEEDALSWIFDVDPQWRVELCSLTAVGRPESMMFRVKGTRVEIDLADHGVPLEMKTKAEKLKFWRLVRCDGAATPVQDQARPYGHFDHSDLASWRAEVERKATAEERQRWTNKHLHRRRDFEEKSRDHFVNPYTFVPFPDQPPRRCEPHGHHTLEGKDGGARFTGRVTARLVARSPLLVRKIGSAAPVVDGVAEAPRTGTGDLFIPGSSLHGAIRALHETLTGSCLRVFDPDFVPVYRDVAGPALRRGWALGVVDETDQAGRPTALTRCDDTRWVELTTLYRAMAPGGVVTTGQRFRLTETNFTQKNNRQIYQESAPATLDPDGEWVVLVTDDSARDPKQSYYCAVGRLPAVRRPVALTDRAWQEYLRAAKGAKQSFADEGTTPNLAAELEQLTQSGTGLGDVIGDPKLARGKGRWLRPRQWLHEGQVVWLAPSKGGYVDGVALSYLWRTRGQGSSGERLPDVFHPCHDPKDLCPSCRVFGSADVREVSGGGVDRRLADQRSYRGHIRILDAVMESGGALGDPVVLLATGSPRPGSGQFYLDDPEGDQVELEYQQPRNRWGSPADVRHLRRLRGRKFYWHTDPGADERRGRWRAHEHAPQGELAELVTAGSTYRLDVVFDGLTSTELGGLLAALQPDRLFATQQQPLPYPVTGDPPEYAVHVGGGKPFGLGSCQVQELRIVADSIESRYLGAQRPVLDPAELVAAFAADRDDLAPTWQHLAAALHTGHVDSRIVSYPTARSWEDDNGTCSGQEQHWAFEWFQQSTGEAMKNSKRARPFVPLPPVSDIAPALPVHVEGDK